MSKGRKAMRETCDKDLEIPKRFVTSSANVNRREETEDIFGRFRKFPELGIDQRVLGLFGYHKRLTLFQYGSSAGTALGSESLKIPCLNTSFESELPMLSRLIS